MLNGKKSYLISFTALFAKKGYELKVGVEEFINSNNQYHLTAPVNSTYRTLKEDTMRDASKVPHSATGLFGRLFRAKNITEHEGFEIETVVASITSYLSDIHRHFNGETVSIVETEVMYSTDKLERAINADVATANETQSAPDSTYIQEIMEGGLYDVIAKIDEINKAKMPMNSETGEYDDYDTASPYSRLEGLVDGVNLSRTYELDLNAMIERAESSSIVRQILSGGVDIISHATHAPNDVNQGCVHYGHEGYVIGNDSVITKTGYAETVENMHMEKWTTHEIHMKAITLDVEHRASSRALIDLEQTYTGYKAEVTAQAIVEGTENATNSMSLDSQAELFTVADTYGNGEENVCLTEVESVQNGELSEAVAAEDIVDIDLQKTVFSETFMDSDMQDYTQIGLILEGHTQETITGDLIQPTYDGKVEGRIVDSENIANTLIEETVFYFTEQSAHIEEYTEAGTEIHPLVELPHLAEAIIYYFDSNIDRVDSSTAHIKEGLTLTTTIADNHQNADLQLLRRADTSNDTIIYHTSLSTKHQEEGVSPVGVEFGREEVGYESYSAMGLSATERNTKDAHEGSVLTEGGQTTEEAVILFPVRDTDYGRAADVSVIANSHQNLETNNADGAVEYASMGLVWKSLEADNERFTDTLFFNEGLGTNKILTDSVMHLGEGSLVEHILDTKNITKDRDGVVEELTAAETGPSIKSDTQVLLTFEQLKDIIANEPEIMRTVRLMEIMYGSRAVELIEAGMEDIMHDSLNEGFSASDKTAITESVIEQIKQAGAGVTAYASTQEYSQADQNKSGDVLVDSAEQGKSEIRDEATKEEVVMSSIYAFNRPTDLAALSRSIVQASHNMSIDHEINKAELATFGIGLKPQENETADTISKEEVVVKFTETAETGIGRSGEGPYKLKSVTKGIGFEGVLAETDTGQTISSGEGILCDTEMTDYSVDRNTVDGPITSETAVSSASATGIERRPEWAEFLDFNRKALIQEIERTDYRPTDYVTFKDGLEEATYSESLSAVSAEAEEAASSSYNESVVHKIEETSNGSSTTGVNHDSETAYINDRSNFTTVATYKQATNDGVSQEALFAEQESTESSRKEEAVIQAGTQADTLSGQSHSVYEDVDSATRKKTQLETDIENSSRGDNKRPAIETKIVEPEDANRRRRSVDVRADEPVNGLRPMRVVVTSIETPEDATRHKEMETAIIKPEGGTMKTPETPKKPRIWLILGKIASWSIWNWKKTR
ncbi:hypothetical protein SECTIM467_44 [Brevibacillus phage SecTim467]|uniref:Uncharacterized protein n=2 Tax=Jenstvirus jenst TaxID=1982225 RepID=A0A0K2CP84_9CAUD|nr:hypothetical protein AVV11_gp147 [Brevibacillus phage Jenst]ALA07174.1 hypothetical protein JENST_44 [Brevibacillus phage Jenst]ALA07543.1 hypothetical protein SECTIM467_44 [Brevibacillus phage SecTim467]